MAANRDEFHARPASPAAWGTDAAFTDILAGRDLEAGGTWLGVRRDGRFALVTNVREGGAHDPAARSRGELVPRVLNATTPPDRAMRDIADTQARYNGFNLLAGDASAVYLDVESQRPTCERFTDGIHGLSNALIDTPWPKLSRTKRACGSGLRAGDADTAPLFAALADRAPAPDAQLPATGIALERERLLSAPFIVSDGYGTRCSTVFTIDRAGHARFHERTFDPQGQRDRRGEREIRAGVI